MTILKSMIFFSKIPPVNVRKNLVVFIINQNLIIARCIAWLKKAYNLDQFTAESYYLKKSNRPIQHSRIKFSFGQAYFSLRLNGVSFQLKWNFCLASVNSTGVMSWCHHFISGNIQKFITKNDNYFYCFTVLFKLYRNLK